MTVELASRFSGAFHQTRVRHEILHARKAGNVMDFIEDDQRQRIADARYGLQEGQTLGIMFLGAGLDMPFQLGQLLIIEIDQCTVEFDALFDLWIGKALGHVDACAIGFPADPGTKLRQVVLAIGVLDVRQELGALPHQVIASAHEVAGGAHFGRIDIGLREHARAQQCCNFLRIDAVILDLAAMDGFHVQRMTEDEGQLFAGAQVGQPVPGEDAFDADNQVGAVSMDSPQLQGQKSTSAIRKSLQVSMRPKS